MSGPAATTSDCCDTGAENDDLRPAQGPDADAELATFAKALGHPARVQILRISITISSFAVILNIQQAEHDREQRIHHNDQKD